MNTREAPLAPALDPGSEIPIRVAIVEDDPHFLSAFTTAIALAPDMQLAGSAQTIADGRFLLDQAPADVLVVDLGLPDGCGSQLIAMAGQAWPGCFTLVSTVFGDEAHVIRSLEAGAAGYLLKDNPAARMVEDIRIVVDGGSPVSPLIARQLLMRFRQGDTRLELAPEPAPEVGPQPRLSPREQETLELITKGFSYEEIGTLMGVSRNTVLSFVRRIYAKLQVRSQIEAIFEARSQGLLRA